MKTQLVRCGLVVGLALAAMGMGACPATMTSTGGTTGTGGTSTPGASMTAAELQLGMDALAAMNTHRATAAPKSLSRRAVIS